MPLEALVEDDGPTFLAWQNQAACRNYPEEWFFGGASNQWGTKRAKKICFGECPVRIKCRDYADEVETSDGSVGDSAKLAGIYGGEGIKERITRRREARDAKEQEDSDS